MFKTIFRAGCLSIILVILFLVIALWSGGNKFREWGEETKKLFSYLGEQADTIKKKLNFVEDTTRKTKKEVENLK